MDPSPAPQPEASPSEAFGRYLARERELRGISLEHVSGVTKISVGNLAALEEGRLNVLPGRAFVVGYIRSYARCVGLSPDDAVLRFQECTAHASAAAGTATAPPRRRRWSLLAVVLVAAIAGAVALLLLRR